MINNMDRKTYKERLYCLKLWKLEEKRNRHDLIEVVKMRKGLSRLKLNELYTLNDKVREPEGNSWKLVKFWCTQDCCKYFSTVEYSIDVVSWISGQFTLPALML